MSTAAIGYVPRTDNIPWLQHGLALAASVRTAHVSRRLRRGEDVPHQETTWRSLMSSFAATEFGRATGIENSLSYPEFQRRVAPRTYEDFAPWIERMTRGAADVLWPGRCEYYAVSSGTTIGRTKYLPLTKQMLGHFRRAAIDSLCFYAHRTGNSRVFRGRHLFLGGSSALQPLPDTGGFAAWSGDLSGIAAHRLPRWAERHLYEPGREIAQIADWPAKLRAIVQRTMGRNITLLAGIPSWILIFAEQMRAETGSNNLKAVWPGLECLTHGGVPVPPFIEQLRIAMGPGVNLHEVYPASEGFIAAQDAEPAAGLRLLTAAGIFYEFLPIKRFDPSRLEQLTAEVIPLSEVQLGVDYALLMTTPAGLCRYVIGDVIRFVSTSPSRVIYVGRTNLQLSAFGEHVIEKELTDSLAVIAGRHGAAVTNFHVAPRFSDLENGSARGRHEWWIESKVPFDAGGMANLATELDGELQRRNDDYEAKRKNGGLQLPLVHLVQLGTFERWMKSCGKWGGQNKMPRCRSDRLIADQLAALAR